MRNLFYYRLEEAEKIIETYRSWIGREAHIGRGCKETLKSIVIKPKRGSTSVTKPAELYRVEFEFETKKKFSAREFFFHNSLTETIPPPFSRAKKNRKAL
jgi:hypothetical protein